MRSYSSGYHRYTEFCSCCGYQPLPTSETILSQFVDFLGQQQLKHKIIKSYLASIRFFHIINNRGDPFIRDMPRLQYVIRAIKSEEVKKDKQSRPRLPITPAILSKIHQILLKDPYSFDNTMLWAASLLCFFGFLTAMTLPLTWVTAIFQWTTRPTRRS